MDDLDERPAVPPQDTGGDERDGWFVAGGLLVVLGFGVLFALNVVLHRLAPTSGFALGPVRVFSAFGPFAWASVALGLVTGVLGLVLLGYARSAPRGAFVLPGQPY